VRGIEGCYSNVVGLPLSLLADMLKEFDRSVL
jgi:septum formation protein